jgi:hypothetical protein
VSHSKLFGCLSAYRLCKRYPRKSRVQAAQAAFAATPATHGAPTPTSLQSVDSPARHVGQPPQREHPSLSSGGNGMFFGESNFLTCIPETAAGNGAANAPDAEKNRLCHPISYQVHAGEVRHDDTDRSNKDRYLESEGVFALPTVHGCHPALETYFRWFHPCFPILDRGETAYQYSIGKLSPLLLQAILFISATYCEEDTIYQMGFKDRLEAKSQLYNRAKILFEADWETDKVTTLQAVFLLSFCRGGSSNVKDVRYWLNIAVTLAQAYGFHRQ